MAKHPSYPTKQIPVLCYQNDEPLTLEVEAYICGDCALHPAIGGKRGTWAISLYNFGNLDGLPPGDYYIGLYPDFKCSKAVALETLDKVSQAMDFRADWQRLENLPAILAMNQLIPE